MFRDVVRQSWADAEAQFVDQDQRPNNAQFRERVLDPVHLHHSVDDRLEKLIIARVDLPLAHINRYVQCGFTRLYMLLEQYAYLEERPNGDQSVCGESAL